MKKLLIVSLLLAGIISFSLLNSCVHQLPGDPCTNNPVQLTITPVDASPGQNDGAIRATATGGSGFLYSLNGSAFQDSGYFSGLQPFLNYNVVVKNSWGCTDTAQAAININDPCAGVTVLVTAVKTDAGSGLSNGTITASATGGTGFTFSINGGAFQSSGNFTGLAVGTYTITAKNSNGCLGTIQVNIVSSNPCAGITVAVTTTQVNPAAGQSNGSITASATGGTGFTYSLDGGAFQTSGTFSGLAAGNYTVTAKSSAGCLGSSQVTLVAVSACSAINITISTAIVTYTPCTTPASGKITVTAGGSSGFTYNINGGAYQTSNVFSTLTAGNYTIGVKDANGCTKTATATVSNTPMGPLFSGMRTLISSRCNGSGCHIGTGNNASGYNFDNDCSIVSKWSQINQSCVTYTLKKMPKSPQSLLTAAEKLVITNWINAGHRFTD
jgi:hypothetical protein